jgi:hypothetical protein
VPERVLHVKGETHASASKSLVKPTYQFVSYSLLHTERTFENGECTAGDKLAPDDGREPQIAQTHERATELHRGLYEGHA